MFVTPGYAATTADPAPAGEGHTEAGTEHGEGQGLFPPFDPSHFPSQLLWLAIIFGLFYLFLKRVALPRVGSSSRCAASASRTISTRPPA